MDKIKCITFDKTAQDNLPQHIKDKMKANMENALELEYKDYMCTNCETINHRKNNEEIVVGYCKKCGHPLWN